jgi:hypothetical protein
MNHHIIYSAIQRHQGSYGDTHHIISINGTAYGTGILLYSQISIVTTARLGTCIMLYSHISTPHIGTWIILYSSISSSQTSDSSLSNWKIEREWTWKWRVVPMYGYATPFWRHFHVVFDVRVLDLNLSNYKGKFFNGSLKEILSNSKRENDNFEAVSNDMHVLTTQCKISLKWKF